MGESEAGVSVGDTDEFIILGDAVGTGKGTSLELAGAETNGEMYNTNVLGLAGAMRHDGVESGAFG